MEREVPEAGAVRFGEYELDSRRGVLSRKGIVLKLQPQPLRVLTYLIARSPEIVTREELGGHIWGEGVHVDLEQSLNYCIRQIRLVLDDRPVRPRFVETLPRQGYRFVGEVEVEVAAAVVAAPIAGGAGELTVGREIPDAAVGRPEEVTPGRLDAAEPKGLRWWMGRRGLLWAAVCGAAAVVGLASAGWMRRSGGEWVRPPGRIRSLAVLPLDNLSGDPGQDYFADGMTDELTTMLAKNSTLRVVSRTSAMQYKGVHRPLPEIARELGVDGVLEGSVAHSGDHVHMTIQLIQASDDAHLWAESYDRQGAGAVSLPAEAARTIAKQLHGSSAQAAPVRYVRPEAHDAYLRGRYLWFLDKNEEAGRYFRKATELQPDYALGWAGLSVYYGAGVIEGELDPRGALEQQEATATRAVELDDSLAEGHLALAAALFTHRWDWARADGEVTRAIELNPGFAEAYHLRSKMQTALNQGGDAIAAERRATELDPFARPFAMTLVFWSTRQFDAAINEARQRLETAPGDATLHGMLYRALVSKGELKEGAEELATYIELRGDREAAAAVRRAYERGGYRGVLDWRLGGLMQRKAAGRYVSPVSLATIYAQLGRREQTLAMLEEGYRQHSPPLLWMQTEPAFDFLHSDERYRAIVRGIGLPPAF